MNIDGNFILGAIVFPLYIYESVIEGGHKYEAIDLILANCNIVCIIIASTGLTAGLAVGQAGPVQAIEMMKTVWQIILTIAIDGSIPIPMEIAGCVTGLTGVVVIVLNKKTKAE
jgi:hypothetical protein